MKRLKALLALAAVFTVIFCVSPITRNDTFGMTWIPLVYAGDQGNSTGTATVGNVAPTLTVPMLLTNALADANNTNIDVWTEYKTNCTVGDTNTLYDLYNVTFYIFESNVATYASADANATHYTFVYSNTTDAFTETGPLGGHLVTADCVKPDRTKTSDQILLAFKLAKIANDTDTKSWRVNMTVRDSANNYANKQTLVFGINFYGELTVVDGTHGWSTLSPGDSNVQIDSPVDLKIDFTVTSNRLHKLQAKSWNATLTDASAHTFDIGNVTIHKDTLLSGVPLTTGYVDVGGDTGLVAVEGGDEYFTLWITVPAGQASGTYTYVLGCQVASG